MILRLYVATAKPSKALQVLVKFVCKVYALIWFSIKCKPSCKYASRHLHEAIKRSRYLPQELKKVIDPVIQRNGYYAHPENILLSMLTDDRQYVRELGLRRILKVRKNKTQGNLNQRKFKIPKIVFDSKDYIDMINWKDEIISEPPIIAHVSDLELKNLIQDPVTPAVEFPLFPCHTQAVERGVKLVSEASGLVCGFNSRNGLILSKLESQKKIKVFDTKHQYVASVHE